MTSWADIQADAPDFAARVRRVFDAGTNKTIATLRSDGSPRISGTELEIANGRVMLGMMPRSRKLDDVRRDGRCAIHSPTIEPPENSLGLGDAKLSGVLVPIKPPSGDGTGAGFFELDITEAVLTWVEDDELVIQSWHPGRGVEQIKRK